MKRISILMLTMFVVVGFVMSCTEKSGTTKAEKKPAKPKITIYQIEKVELPDWYYDDDVVIKKEAGDKSSFIYFKMYREAPTGNKAMKAAKADLKATVTEAIKNITSTEMIKASEGMLNDKDVMDEYFQETVASISRNVDISGLIPAGNVVEHIGKQIPGKADVETYRATIRYKMNYGLFQDKLINSIKKVVPKVIKEVKEEKEVKKEVKEEKEVKEDVVVEEKTEDVVVVVDKNKLVGVWRMSFTSFERAKTRSEGEVEFTADGKFKAGGLLAARKKVKLIGTWSTKGENTLIAVYSFTYGGRGEVLTNTCTYSLETPDKMKLSHTGKWGSYLRTSEPITYCSKVK